MDNSRTMGHSAKIAKKQISPGYETLLFLSASYWPMEPPWTKCHWFCYHKRSQDWSQYNKKCFDRLLYGLIVRQAIQPNLFWSPEPGVAIFVIHTRWYTPGMYLVWPGVCIYLVEYCVMNTARWDNDTGRLSHRTFQCERRSLCQVEHLSERTCVHFRWVSLLLVVAGLRGWIIMCFILWCWTPRAALWLQQLHHVKLA